MVTASMSTQVLSTPVEQTYLAAMSPTHHLSSLTSVPRLLLESQEMLPSPPTDVLLSSSTQERTPAIHLTLSANNKRLDPIKHRIMSRSDEQLAASRRSAAVYGTDRRVGEFPRSVSIADLKAGSRNRKAECGSDLRRVLPSVTNLRNLALNQDADARIAERSQTHPAPALFHQRRYVASNLHDEHIYNEKRLRRKFHWKSYQDLHILSMYQEDNPSVESLTSIGQKAPSSIEPNDPSSASCSDSSSSRGSSPAPKTPVDQRPPHEAEDAKVRRAHARQVQLIEQRQDQEQAVDEIDGEEEEGIIQVMFEVLVLG